MFELVKEFMLTIPPEYPDIKALVFQKDDFLHCFLLSLQGINGILADEMGLGKTVQSIALLAHLAEVRRHQDGEFLSAHSRLCCSSWLMKTCPVPVTDAVSSPLLLLRETTSGVRF